MSKNEFKDCQTAEEILRFFQDEGRALRHTNFYHYTSLSNVNNILKSKELWLNSLAESANDNEEKDRYAEIGRNVFSVCFSTGTSESLPLWYLYSGIDGKGARIELKKSAFKKLIGNELKISLLEIEDGPDGRVRKGPTLTENDYKFLCHDILYIGKDSQKPDKYRIKYNNNTMNGVTSSCAEKIKEEYERFYKGLIWFYEKETRIQVEINDRKLEKGKKYKVAISLESVYNDLSIRLAPEFGTVSPEIFTKYEGIREWTSAKIRPSDYAGQMHMGLRDKLCEACIFKSENSKAK